MQFELDDLGGNESTPRFVKITKRDKGMLRVDAGVRTGPGIVFLTRRDALVLARALQAMAEGLE